jgi:hypothetical protein
MFEIKNYTPSDSVKGWDGLWRGTPQVVDSYKWIAEAVGLDGKVFKRMGSAMLLR